MKRFLQIAIITLILTGLFTSCNNSYKKSDNFNQEISISNVTTNEIRNMLETGDNVERSHPFNQREFNPNVKNSLIGNAVSYGCYRKGQAPGAKGPTEKEILEDLKIIQKYWNVIRVYNADDDTERILKVIRENKIPLKVMLGVWLATEKNRPKTKKENVINLLRSIKLSNEYLDIVVAVNVGNESQVFWSGHKLNSEILTRYIRVVRNNTKVPITTADDYNFWNKSTSLNISNEIDFIVTHIYPLWNGKTLDESTIWLQDTFEIVKKMHPNKKIILGEIGWATVYNPEKIGPGQQGTLIKGEVGILAQEAFLYKLDKWISENKVTTFLFEVFDEPWKGGGVSSGPKEIEKNWGLFYENRKPKESFKNFIKKNK